MTRTLGRGGPRPSHVASFSTFATYSTPAEQATSTFSPTRSTRSARLKTNRHEAGRRFWCRSAIPFTNRLRAARMRVSASSAVENPAPHRPFPTPRRGPERHPPRACRDAPNALAVSHELRRVSRTHCADGNALIHFPFSIGCNSRNERMRFCFCIGCIATHFPRTRFRRGMRKRITEETQVIRDRGAQAA